MYRLDIRSKFISKPDIVFMLRSGSQARISYQKWIRNRRGK